METALNGRAKRAAVSCGGIVCQNGNICIYNIRMYTYTNNMCLVNDTKHMGLPTIIARPHTVSHIGSDYELICHSLEKSAKRRGFFVTFARLDQATRWYFSGDAAM